MTFVSSFRWLLSAAANVRQRHPEPQQQQLQQQEQQQRGQQQRAHVQSVQARCRVLHSLVVLLVLFTVFFLLPSPFVPVPSVLPVLFVSCWSTEGLTDEPAAAPAPEAEEPLAAAAAAAATAASVGAGAAALLQTEEGELLDPYGGPLQQQQQETEGLLPPGSIGEAALQQIKQEEADLVEGDNLSSAYHEVPDAGAAAAALAAEGGVRLEEPAEEETEEEAEEQGIKWVKINQFKKTCHCTPSVSSCRLLCPPVSFCFPFFSFCLY